MSDVAVIGAGIFGCMSALRLSAAGHDVTLYERRAAILDGTSKANQNRLHLGYHYPRSHRTMRQCFRGFDRFVDTFGACLRGHFPNVYFLADGGSSTTEADYRAACRAAGLPWRPVDVAAFRPEVRGVSCGIDTDECVYDVDELRRIITTRLAESAVHVVADAHVTGLGRLAGGGYEVQLLGGMAHDAHIVVNCAYANQNALTHSLGLTTSSRRYEYTAIAVIGLDWEPVGITVMDGPFFTVLPLGKTGKFLLYHVVQSVVASAEGHMLDAAWLDEASSPFARQDGEAWFAGLIGACVGFVPALRAATMSGVLTGPRMLLDRSDATDARPSFVTQHEPGYLTVFAGKIDHCIEAADDVVRMVGTC